MTISNRFIGKTAIVTGAASGIGEASAKRLSDEGADVILVDRDNVRGETLAKDIGGTFYACDLSDIDSLDSTFRTIAHDTEQIHILINNAGIGGASQTTPDVPPDTWRNVMAVNIDAIFYTCRIIIPKMASSGGSITNTASISGLFGDYGFTAYNASKGAVVNYTRALALDHARDNIRVNAICPGFIETPMTEQVNMVPAIAEAWRNTIPLKRAGTPDEIANVIAFLNSDEASYITGAVITADGGLTAGTGQPNLLDILPS